MFQYAYAQPTRFTDPTGETPAAAGLCFIPGAGWVSCGAAAVGAVIVAIAAAASGKAASQAGDYSEYANCPDPEECERLKAEVRKAKKEVGALGRCRPGMTPGQLAARYAAWVRLGVARARRDMKCYDGGDEGH